MPVQRLAELTAREWLWLLQSLLLLPLAWLCIRLFGWQRTMTRFGRLAGDTPVVAGGSLDAKLAVAAARIVRVAATFGPSRVSCLPRAVVLWTLLRRHGQAAVVRLGVRKGAAGVDAHAWVEVDGLSLDDPSDQPFQPLSSVPLAQVR
jgi:hypothetical protein